MEQSKDTAEKSDDTQTTTEPQERESPLAGGLRHKAVGPPRVSNPFPGGKSQAQGEDEGEEKS